MGYNLPINGVYWPLNNVLLTSNWTSKCTPYFCRNLLPGSEALVVFIESLSTGSLVACGARDDAMGNLSFQAKEALKTCDSVFLESLESWGFLGEPEVGSLRKKTICGLEGFFARYVCLTMYIEKYRLHIHYTYIFVASINFSRKSSRLVKLRSSISLCITYYQGTKNSWTSCYFRGTFYKAGFNSGNP